MKKLISALVVLTFSTQILHAALNGAYLLAQESVAMSKEETEARKRVYNSRLKRKGISLISAVQAGELYSIKNILWAMSADADADLDAKDEHGMTAFAWALMLENQEVLDVLTQAGATIDSVDFHLSQNLVTQHNQELTLHRSLQEIRVCGLTNQIHSASLRINTGDNDEDLGNVYGGYTTDNGCISFRAPFTARYHIGSDKMDFLEDTFLRFPETNYEMDITMVNGIRDIVGFNTGLKLVTTQLSQELILYRSRQKIRVCGLTDPSHSIFLRINTGNKDGGSGGIHKEYPIENGCVSIGAPFTAWFQVGSDGADGYETTYLNFPQTNYTLHITEGSGIIDSVDFNTFLPG